MKLSELLQGVTVVQSTVDPELEITGISYDSRTTKPGDLFVAISGFAADGHRFISAAQQAGAVAVVCEKMPKEAGNYLVTPSSRAALAQLSANWFGHPADEMCMIGVTGTNGKTTVTYLLKTVLEQTMGAKVGLIGTIQNMIGGVRLHTERTTPESYELQQLFRQMRDAGCTHVIMEVSSHALALDRVLGLRFDVGIFTNLTQDHLDFHKTMEAYRDAKGKLFTQCKTGIVNLDDAAAAHFLRTGTCAFQTYSVERNDGMYLARFLKLKSDRVEMDVVNGNEICRFELGIPGRFTVYNALAVIAAPRLLIKLPIKISISLH